jgi:tellurite resistance protein
MQNEARINLLARIAQFGSVNATGPAAGGGGGDSILALAAASYGLRPSRDATVPTGFDPVAVALFEAIVEGAYLVATADNVFDDEEKHTFQRVVAAACGGVVANENVSALVSDLADQLREDGLDRRIGAVARAITKREHALEVLRVAALLAQATEDVAPQERQVLQRLASECKLDEKYVDEALRDAREAIRALGSA